MSRGPNVDAMDLRHTLHAELARRQQTNPRYSLRAYARALGTHHGTLSRLLRRHRRLTPRSAARICARLGLPAVVGSDAYLRDILPSRDPAPAVSRPPCD